MIQVKIEVNGCLIGHVHATNKGKILGGGFVPTEMTRYDYEFYRAGAGIDHLPEGKTDIITTGMVEHEPKDGAIVLVKKILCDIVARRFEDTNA